MVNAMAGISGVIDRGSPAAATEAMITRVVFEELNRARPSNSTRRLSRDASLASCGIDAARFLDAIHCLEGRYGMRFCEEWFANIVTCGDLIECVTACMFDAGDRAVVAEPQPVARERFPECAAFEDRLEGLRVGGLVNPFLRANESVQGRTARINGTDTVSFTSFDYLGLAGHAAVKRAAKEAIDRFGCSASASRMVGGNTTIHDQLDAELAAFLRTERAVVFPCGYGTNASVFGHLFGKEDLILYDALAHNSMVQGAIASAAAKRSFRHNDYRQLDALLRDLRPNYRRVVVAI